MRFSFYITYVNFPIKAILGRKFKEHSNGHKIKFCLYGQTYKYLFHSYLVTLIFFNVLDTCSSLLSYSSLRFIIVFKDSII